MLPALDIYWPLHQKQGSLLEGAERPSSSYAGTGSAPAELPTLCPGAGSDEAGLPPPEPFSCLFLISLCTYYQGDYMGS